MRVIPIPTKPLAGTTGVAVKVADEQMFVASQWQLMWWKFRRHRLAMVSGLVVVLLYVTAIFVEPLSAYDPEAQNVLYAYRAPTTVHFIDAQNNFRFPPIVYAVKQKRDLETLALVYTEAPAVNIRSACSCPATDISCGG